jgi:REP element-mobilizing transposase RayT
MIRVGTPAGVPDGENDWIANAWVARRSPKHDRSNVRVGRNDMPSTHSSLHYHITFSTKDRIATIMESWREQLHAYIGGTVRGLDGTPLQVGGVADHVHLLVGLRPTHCLADFVREVKKATTTWVHHDTNTPHFLWQDGYGAFTVSRSDVEGVAKYIQSQEDHHRRWSFKDEFLSLLKKHGIEYDERYL